MFPLISHKYLSCVLQLVTYQERNLEKWSSPWSGWHITKSLWHIVTPIRDFGVAFKNTSTIISSVGYVRINCPKFSPRIIVTCTFQSFEYMHCGFHLWFSRLLIMMNNSCVCVCTFMQVCHGTCVVLIQWQLLGICSLLLSCRSQGLSSGCPAQQSCP